MASRDVTIGQALCGWYAGVCIIDMQRSSAFNRAIRAAGFTLGDLETDTLSADILKAWILPTYNLVYIPRTEGARLWLMLNSHLDGNPTDPT